VGPGNHVLDEGPDSPGQAANLGEEEPIVNIGTFCCELCKHGIVGSGGPKHSFNRIRQVAPMCPHRMAHWRHLANTTEPSVCGGDAALCQITLTTCLSLVRTVALAVIRLDYFILILVLTSALTAFLSELLTSSIARSAKRRLFTLFRADFDVFRPAGTTRCTYGSEIWRV